MAQNKSSGKSILIQGSILVAASFISRLIGLIYRFPMVRIIGKVGMDYYGTAYSIYSILLIVSTYSVPTAISKMISERLAKGEEKNARKIFRASLVFSIVCGGAGTLIFLLGADFFAGIVQTPLSSIALRVLAPVLLVSSVVGALRGFFQGFNTMIPTAISQIIEQIANAVVSVAAAWSLYSYGKKSGALLMDKNLPYAYGAAGGTLGTVAGAVFALIFLIGLMAIYSGKHRKRRLRNGGPVMAYPEIVRLIIVTVIPIVLSSVVYNITSLAEMVVFKNIAAVQHYSSRQVSIWWTEYNQEYIVLQNVPIAVASSLASPSVPSLAESYVTGDKKGIQEKISSVTRFIMAIVLPITVGMFVLASPVMQVLFGDTDFTTSKIMMLGAVSIPFFSLSAMSSGILQGINKLKVPLMNSLVTLFAHMGLLAVLLLGFHLNIYAVVIANAFDGILMAVLNDYFVVRYSGVRYNVRRVFLAPAVSSVLMGVLVYAVYYILNALTRSTLIPFVISVFCGIVVYFVLIIKTGGITKRELLRLPGGTRLVSLARKMKILS